MDPENQEWVEVCRASDIDVEDVMGLQIGGEEIAVFHCESGFFATHGICTHSRMGRLADGLVSGDIIECPRHQGRFHIPSGAARSAPATVALKTYPLKIEDGRIYMRIARA